jgi:glycerophosphoryl diester phosphodiesterase
MWYKNRISVPVLLASLNVLFVLSGFSQSFEKMAHRGGSALMPENTIIAMQNALDFGVSLEMDLYLSKDKQVFVYHDDKLSPKFGSNPDGTPVTQEQAAKKKIIDFTYAELKPYDMGIRAHPDFPRRKRVKAGIPLFSELIDSVESYARSGGLRLPNYSIEIKVPNASLAPRYKADLVDSAIRIIRAKNILARVIVQSFDIEVLEYLHKEYPLVKAAYLVGQGDYLDNLKKLSFTPTAYSPPYQLVTPELIAYCHTNNMQVVTWTVNNKKDIERLRQMGVDVVMSDYPDYFLP